MAYKSIKKGKRKGGKKSNRRTYKQNGGNKLFFIIALLVSLGLIFPVSAKLFTNSKEQYKQIVEATDQSLIDATNKANNYKVGLSSGMIISLSGSIFGQNIYKDNLNKTVNDLSNLIKKIYGDDYLVITESYLFHLIRENLGEDSLTTISRGLEPTTDVKIPDVERTLLDRILGNNNAIDLGVALGTGKQFVPGAGEHVYIVSPATVSAMADKGIRGEIRNLLTNLIEANNSGSVIDNGPKIEEMEGGSKL
jgi:hypothetical protein